MAASVIQAGRLIRSHHARLAVVLTVAVLLLPLWPAPASASPAAQDADFPIFDTHLHYSQDAWGLFSPQDIIALMDQAGVYRALMSSTPDDGTLHLVQFAPGRIVPVLRPYRTRADMTTWTGDGSAIAYVEERLAKGGYRGIGEFHIEAGDTPNRAPRRFADLAAEYDIVLHAHTDAAGVVALAGVRSDAKILWAHAGMSASPATIDDVLTRCANVWVETALRTDIASGGQIDPAWAALFTKYPDRFMIGTDTWIPSRWPQLPRLMADVRAWLRQLPRELAERIASGNAEALFGR
ncbi:MAG: amidohydrolase family protein [Chloroflexi bacterium]|nr:amidohydrolase family protein [Chloroflexota bacterium]